MQIMPKQLAQNQDYSRAKINSKDQIINGSYSEGSLYSMDAEHQCHFCTSKYHILRQLEVLKQAILQKNNKIKELETFIQRLSKMAFTDYPASNHTSQSMRQQLQSRQSNDPSLSEELTFAQRSPFTHQKTEQEQSFNTNKSLKQQIFSKSSQIKSQFTPNEQENIRLSIKNSIKNMQIDKQPIPSGNDKKVSTFPKESLRKKLIDIINILPKSQGSSNVHSFETQSQPLNEGQIGMVNSKFSESIQQKQSGFTKKQCYQMSKKSLCASSFESGISKKSSRSKFDN